MSVVERRLELLKLEGNGFNHSEIEKNLSEKFQVSERAVYYDFEKRGEWQPYIMQVQNPERALMKILSSFVTAIKKTLRSTESESEKPRYY